MNRPGTAARIFSTNDVNDERARAVNDPVEVVGTAAARRINPITAPPPRQLPRRPIHPVPTPTNGARPVSRDVIREVENGQVVWRVRCGDLINRDRCVTVFVDNGQVVVTGPPGETARLTPVQISQLKAVLNEAAKLAER
jgi:hypothetical protein